MSRTGEPGTEDAERLALLMVIGTQTLVVQPGSGGRRHRVLRCRC
ncbi:hypothetical protein ACIBBB_14505 [Streptomyces sp. NPDC051217]